jgi:uncharacterized protein (TIGR02246 family)
MTGSKLRIGVIAGSTRPGRQARAVAEWVCADTVPKAELTLVDLADVGLPLLAEPVPAAFGEYQLQDTKDWSSLVDGFDGFVLVSPEYNHSTSAALKNALDHLYGEWRDKAVAFVGYGLEGGTRAVEHLRGITAELGMAGVGPQVSISLRDDYVDGRLEPRPFQLEARDRMLTPLLRWASALRPLRLVPTATDERPRLNDSTMTEVATEAATEFVAELQAGLDRGDADLYDRHFAADVIWGSPYGATVSGLEAINAIHRMLMAEHVAPTSRYEIVQVHAPRADVVVAHVRRQALVNDEGDDPSELSEMAMYVLIERGGSWWLAGGQNTPIRERSS